MTPNLYPYTTNGNLVNYSPKLTKLLGFVAMFKSNNYKLLYVLVMTPHYILLTLE